MARNPEVAIVGGGVIGCSIAFRLAQAGARVAVFEREHVGFGASNASAGMVAPLSDSNELPAVQELGLASFRIYADFVREIEEESGIGVECVRAELLRVAVTEDEERTGRESVAKASRTGLKVEWLSGGEARKLEPLLSPSILGAMYSHDEMQLSPFRLTEALKRVATGRGATVREHTPVVGLLKDGTKVKGVRLPDGEVEADAVVIAAGSWAPMNGDWLDFKIPLFPVRGQGAYATGVHKPLKHSVFRGPSYAVPKGDGSVLLGTTVEKAGFDLRVTAGGMASILGAVQTLLPSMVDAGINQTRVGLRPCSADGLPFIGKVPGWEGAIVAAGHYRSGILLSAITSKLVAELITQGRAPAALAPFDPARLEKVSQTQ